MLLQPLMDKLTLLHLPAFRKGIEEQITNPKYADLSFDDRLVDPGGSGIAPTG